MEVLSKKYIIQLGFHNLYKGAQKLGKGSTATVYKTIRLEDNQIVAIKGFNKVCYFELKNNGKGREAFLK